MREIQEEIPSEYLAELKSYCGEPCGCSCKLFRRGDRFEVHGCGDGENRDVKKIHKIWAEVERLRFPWRMDIDPILDGCYSMLVCFFTGEYQVLNDLVE